VNLPSKQWFFVFFFFFVSVAGNLCASAIEKPTAAFYYVDTTSNRPTREFEKKITKKIKNSLRYLSFNQKLKENQDFLFFILDSPIEALDENLEYVDSKLKSGDDVIFVFKETEKFPTSCSNEWPFKDLVCQEREKLEKSSDDYKKHSIAFPNLEKKEDIFFASFRTPIDRKENNEVNEETLPRLKEFVKMKITLSKNPSANEH